MTDEIDELIDEIQREVDAVCGNDTSPECERLEEAVEEMQNFDPRAEVELNPGTVTGTFYQISVSLDGEEPISPYSSVGPQVGNVIEAAEDSYKGQGYVEGEDTLSERIEYLDKMLRLPEPRHPETDETLVLDDSEFYFTQAGFDYYVGSAKRAREVFGDATTYAPYSNVEVFVDTIQNPSGVVYRDSAQIAVGGGPEPLTYTEFTGSPFSYREYDTEMVERLIATVGTERFEKDTEATAREGLEYIESGRWAPVLDAFAEFFIRLDNDERELFTRRNPGLVDWMTVWNEAVGQNPLKEWRDMARAEVGPDGARDPPLFSRDRGSSTGGDNLLSDMMTRRRSYRNWTPGEFREILDMEQIELSYGMARELGFRTAEIRQTMREEGAFPITATAKEVARDLLGRIESGRFAPALNELMTFFSRLDVDERRTFSRRNPGIIMWLSVFGESEHLIHQEQLKAHTFPTLREE